MPRTTIQSEDISSGSISLSGGNLVVDSNGRVTTPSQPFFQGNNSTGQPLAIGTNTLWNPPAIHLNNGNHFNTSNGRFVVPVTGYYLCSLNSLIATANTSSFAYIRWFKNGLTINQSVHSTNNSSRSYEPLNHTVIIYALTNDYLECIVGGGGSAQLYGGEWGGNLTFALLG